MDGVIRTRVGYAGGTTPDPTYLSIGDHCECIQVDYDPARLTYEDLLDVFWSAHRPTVPSRSKQYASAILTADDEQRVAAEASLARAGSRLGRVYTTVAPLGRLHVAEDYHQKYRLRHSPELMAEFREMYPDEVAFRESTAAARVNGYLDGYGGLDELDAEVERYGLGGRGVELLRNEVRLGRRL